MNKFILAIDQGTSGTKPMQNHGALLDQNILSGRLDVKFNVLWVLNHRNVLRIGQ